MCTPSKLVIGTVVCAVAMVALVEANGAGDIWSLAGPNICGIAPDQRQKLGECIAEKLGVPPPPPIKACITDFAKKPKEECEKPEAVDSFVKCCEKSPDDGPEWLRQITDKVESASITPPDVSACIPL